LVYVYDLGLSIFFFSCLSDGNGGGLLRCYLTTGKCDLSSSSISLSPEKSSLSFNSSTC
jgi:hypothetical protein